MLKPALLITASALAVATSLHAQSPTRTFSLDDVDKLKVVSGPERSPDGKWVAYTVSSVDTAKDKRDSDVWMVSWDGSEQVRLTSSKDNESQPRWSPDGKYLAFLTSRSVGGSDDDDEKKDKKKGAQVWLLNRAGGEAEKLTDIEGDIDDYAWSPDSKRLVLIVDDPDPSADPETIEGWKRKTKPPIVIDRYAFKDDQSGYLGKLRSHVYVFDLATKKAEQITSGDFDDRDATWSPDGTRIAFVSERERDADRTNNADIYVVAAKTGAAPTKLTSFNGPDEGKPAWSPDGKSIAYLQGDEARFYAYNLQKLTVIPSTGGTPHVLTESLDRAVTAPIWAPDGKSIYVLVEDDRAQYVAKVPAAGGAVEPLTTGRRVVNALSLGSDGNLAVAASTARDPFEVYALEQGKLRKLTSQNAWAADVAFAKVEDVTFTAKDGTIVNGLLSRPASAPAGQNLPLLLWIHGGPNGQDDHSFDEEREYFVANGYAVLQVNYRGSSGRGSKYQKAIYADWGHLEVIDLLAGVDWAVQSGVADPDRLAIGGWSYGGILTDYTIATDQRFKAANSGAGSGLQLSTYGSDQYIMQYEAELGPPWKTQDLWIKVSYPFFHADRIKTPTLFMASEKDFNVPVIGAEQMYQALRSNGVDAQLVIYPDQHHGIRVPSYIRDRLQRRLAWFDKYLKPSATQSAPPPTGTKQ
jgi:dipeptidyl aminopeptidase/acylaminoacyl peptidase